MEKYEDFSGWSHCNGLPAQWKNTRIFQDGHMIGLEGALFKRWKLEGNEGSKAHSKEWSRARRRTRKESEGSKTHSKGSEGSKTRSKRKVGLGNALLWMVEGSKAHSKRNKIRARRHSQKEVG